MLGFMRRKQQPEWPFPDVTIKQQRRKSMVMRVSAAGEVIVHIPKWVRPHDPRVRRFIEEGLAKLKDQIPEEKPIQQHDARIIRQMVVAWAERMGLSPKRVQFRAMTRKWGSCSSNGNVTLNTALFYLPAHLVEYVVIHELVHMTIFDHSPEFWKKLGQYAPDYEARERELEGYQV